MFTLRCSPTVIYTFVYLLDKRAIVLIPMLCDVALSGRYPVSYTVTIPILYLRIGAQDCIRTRIHQGSDIHISMNTIDLALRRIEL